ncbi:DEAD-box type RNA helicase, partial [Tulasnella sp. 403]
FMVVWMRDALIFANEMVSQYNVFHDVASDTLRQSLVMASPTKSRGTTDVGQQMIEQLNTVIQSTIKWLKLTDPETLHQTVEVMRVLLECFAKAGAKPPKDCLDRLEKYTTYPKTVTVDMTREQLATLAEAILPFTEGEEGKDSSPTDIKGKSKAIGTANRESSSSGARSRRGPSSPAESEEEDDDVVFIEERPSSSASKKPPNVLQQLMDASRKKSDLSSKPYVVDVTPKVSTSGQKRVVSGPDGTKKGIVKTGSRNASGPTSKLQELRRQARQMQPAMPPVPSKRPQDKLSEPKFEGTRPGAASKIAATSSEKGDGSSDSDSDEEHDKEERGLAGLVKVERRPPQVPKKPERRGIVFIDSGVPNVIKQRNDARERARFAQLRLKPDLTRLHRIILGWDYDHEGDDPPDMASLRLRSVKNYRANASGTAASVRCLPPSQELGLHSGTRWTLVKVFSLSTVHREYAGLLSLPYLDLADEILKPRPAKLPVISRDRIQKAVKSFGVNEPQAEAILGAFEIQGFALIQGPPGTGKTSTICGIAGHFLSTRTSGVTAIKPGEGPQKSYPKKLLICAPSNAAIDEVARRLHEGIMDANGKHVVPRVVRIGNESSLNVSVKNISLDSLVDAKMNANPVGGGGGFGDEITSIRQQLDAVNRERSEKLALFRNIENTGADRTALDLQIKDLNAKRSTLNQRLNQTRDRQTDANRAVDAARRRFRQEVLREADIICSTLSGSGHETLEEFDFETVVIDEAAQSVELSSLIPLKYQCQRCILVGDPKQLAPTVLSVTASKYNYQQSMFVRIEKHRPNAVHLLSIQYRMHPSISVLPSKVFYGARIQDGPDMAAKTAKPWHNDPMFPPYQFFNVSGGLEQANGHTLKNAAEAEVALALYNRLATQFSRNGELDRRIGIVTMYRGQMLELKDRFIRRYSTKILGKVDFNTVDGFQGQEKDVIILSCVRAGPGVNSVGFLADTRRMNVALTRSKSSLYVLGHAATLERSDSNWQKIVQDARERRLLKDGVTPSTFTASSLVTTSNTLLKKAKAKMPNQGPSTGTISLLTPRELIAKTTNPTASTSVTVEVLSDAPDTPDPVQEGETGEGRKRKISAELPPRPAPALRSDSEPPSAAESAGPANGGNATGQPAKPPRPRPPPPKARPLEASLFIPQKRPQKRGPPPNNSAGPSNVKRRLAAELQRKPQ